MEWVPKVKFGTTEWSAGIVLEELTLGLRSGIPRISSSNYFALVLAGFTRFANTFDSRRLEPRFLLVTPDVADWTMYAERVMPAWRARRSISSI
jgi:hypothetical protein